MEPFTALGAASSIVSLAKTGLDLVGQIKRSIKDLKDAPIKTEKLSNLLKFATQMLQELERSRPESDSNLRSVLESLQSTLSTVDLAVKDCQRKDLQRKERNQIVEASKNLVHLSSSSSKQIKELAKVESELQDRLYRLYLNISVESRIRIIATYELLIDMQSSLEGVGSSVTQLQQKYESKSKEMVDLLISISSGIDELRLNQAAEDSVNLAQPENDMFHKLELAADFDIESHFCDARVEFKNPGTREPWKVLVPSKRDIIAAAKGEDIRRGSTDGGYEVVDMGSLQFTLSVRKSRFFHFVTHDHVPGAEPELYFPRKTKAKHYITEEETNRCFPDKSNYVWEPRRWGLHKAPGSSNMSTQSVFLVLSKLSLVNGDAESRNAGNLVMSDVVAELERHLAEKLKENGQDYQDLIVKHFKFDVFAA